jgi:ribosomal protein S18 acetylase RimI-like enzyme
LIDEAVKEARMMKYKSIFLEIGTYKPAAHRLYKSAGFEEVEPYPGSECAASFLPYHVFMPLSL